MSRQQAINIARFCAANKPESYTLSNFMPHEWVIDAIMTAGNHGPVVIHNHRPAATQKDKAFVEEVIFPNNLETRLLTIECAIATLTASSHHR